jgi:hypothetical protein
MSLLAEVIVEEWLNRQGYFTIRGIKVGSGEIDLLAIKPDDRGLIERRHIEVQASFKPMGYIVTGRAKRLTEAELHEHTKAWVHKKYLKPDKADLFTSLGGEWSKELVYLNTAHPEEIEAIRECGIKIIRLADIVQELREDSALIKSAAGKDLLELVHLSYSASE